MYVCEPPTRQGRYLLLLEFPTRAEAAGLPNLVTDLFHLAGAGKLDAAGLSGLLPDWESAFVAAGSSPAADKRVALPRLRYYKAAFEAMLAGDVPQAVIWPLMLTWSLAVASLPDLWLEHWRMASQMLGLAGAELDEKMDGLDHFLDGIEEALENFRF